jgi:hypothetical protein
MQQEATAEIRYFPQLLLTEEVAVELIWDRRQPLEEMEVLAAEVRHQLQAELVTRHL